MTKSANADHDDIPNLHSCRLSGISWAVGDPEEGDWTSELTLELDYIVEWICPDSSPCQFRIAPARAIFSGVSVLAVHLGWGSTGIQVSLSDAVIWSVEKAAVMEQKIFLDRPYYGWRIRLHAPERGEISFGAVAYNIRMKSEPVVKDQPRLSRKERETLIANGVLPNLG